MGIDQAIYINNDKGVADDELLCDWYGHKRLHGWMYDAWRAETDDESLVPFDFNCMRFELTEEHILELQSAMVTNQLPVDVAHHGFDLPDLTEDELEYDEECIDKMLKAVKEGKELYYCSYW